MGGGAGAPWTLAGECILTWVPRPVRRSSLPPALRPLPGPAAVVGVRYTESPVGPYLELSVAEPARLGLRPGFCVTTMAVTAPEAAVAYRSNWGLPPAAAALSWRGAGGEHELRWEDRGISLTARAVKLPLPALVPFRLLQRRADGPVLVPRVLAALIRPARAEIAVPGDDDLCWMSGSHPAAVMSGLHVLMRPARTPAGLFSSLRAPRWLPEPAMVETGVPGLPDPVQWRPARALSSVG